MPGTRSIETMVAALAATMVAGCGVGAGAVEEGTAELTVTRDYGAEAMVQAQLEDPADSESVVRFLDREAEIETSYGGNFVDSIDGVSSRVSGGRNEDWFFYVNGYWSPLGAGEVRVRPGDRIWWDYRDWTDSYRVPAVVGSFPEPFSNGFDGESFPTEVVCFDVEQACAEVSERLSEVGADLLTGEAERGAASERKTLRVLVGTWERIREDDAATVLELGPEESGVYGVPTRCGDQPAFEVLDERAAPTALLERAAWVAAVRPDQAQPTWVVSATEADLVSSAAELLDPEALADHYALAVSEGEPRPLPAAGAEQIELPDDCR